MAALICGCCPMHTLSAFVCWGGRLSQDVMHQARCKAQQRSQNSRCSTGLYFHRHKKGLLGAVSGDTVPFAWAHVSARNLTSFVTWLLLPYSYTLNYSTVVPMISTDVFQFALIKDQTHLRTVFQLEATLHWVGDINVPLLMSFKSC